MILIIPDNLTAQETAALVAALQSRPPAITICVEAPEPPATTLAEIDIIGRPDWTAHAKKILALMAGEPEALSAAKPPSTCEWPGGNTPATRKKKRPRKPG